MRHVIYHIVTVYDSTQNVTYCGFTAYIWVVEGPIESHIYIILLFKAILSVWRNEFFFVPRELVDAKLCFATEQTRVAIWPFVCKI